MRTRTQKILSMAGLALFALSTACGNQRAGRYQGFEFAIINDQRTGSQQVTLEIKESGDELVTGTWRSATSSGTFQGYLRSDRIDNLMLERNMASSSSTTSSLPTVGSEPCTGRYMGSLKFDSQRLTGRLTWTQGWGYTNSMGGMNYTGCTAVEIDASKLSN